MRQSAIVFVAIASVSSSLSAQSAEVVEGERLFAARKYSEARQILLPIGKSNADAAFILGKVALFQNDAPQAVGWLEKSVELNPRSSEHYDWLGKAYGSQAQYASKLKQPFLARKTKGAWEKAIALDPGNLEAKEDMIQYYLQAPGFLGGSKDKARSLAMEIKRQNSYRGSIAAATVCSSLKDQPCVESELRSMISSYPDSTVAYTSLGAFYANSKQYDKAFAVIDQRLKLKPTDAAALYALGRTAAISGKRLAHGEEALKQYIVAPAPGGPALANAHYRLGLIYEKQGTKESARREYQAALRLNPKYAEAKKSLAAL